MPLPLFTAAGCAASSSAIVASEINYLEIPGVIVFWLDSSTVNTIEIDANITLQAG